MASSDNIWALVSLFVFVIVMLIAGVVWNSISDIDVLWSQADHGATIKQNTQNFVNNYDFFFVCLYIGLHLSVVAMAFLLRTHPVIYIFSVLLTVILILIAVPMSNAWEEDIVPNNTFALVINDFPMTNHIMTKLPIYEFIWSMFTMIALYSMAKYEDVI